MTTRRTRQPSGLATLWSKLIHTVCPPLNPPITDWQGKRVWIVGASSGIGAATAQALHTAGASVALSARSQPRLHTMQQQLFATDPNPARVIIAPCDVTQHNTVCDAWRRILETWGDCDVILFMAGTYSPMVCQSWDLATANHMLTINLQGCIHVLDCVLPHYLKQPRNKHIAITSSVAGYRGLPRALIYGPTKAALNNLCESLWLDLHPIGIGVHRICPGFVSTDLTAKNDFAMPCVISPLQAADYIVAGFAQGTFEIDFPKRFTRIMRLMALLPHRWYFKLVQTITRS